MKRLLIMLMPISLVACGTKVEKNFEWKNIISVHDGDTFKDNNDIKYRILGADTPEISSGPDFSPTSGKEQIYALMATNFTKNLLLNNFVKVEKIKIDKYNRTVVKIYINQNHVTLAESLIEAGLARVAYISNKHTNNKYSKAPDYYFKDEEYVKKLYDKQLLAAQNKRGFWAEIDKFNIIFPKAY